MPAPKPLPARPTLNLARQKDEPKRMMQAVKIGSTNVYPVSASYGKPVKINPGNK